MLRPLSRCIVVGDFEMPGSAANVPSTVILGMRYHDCPAAIEWLCSVLGFEKKAVYMSEDGTRVDHAELTFGSNGMIMLGSAQNETAYSQFAATPDELKGRETRSAYLIVGSCDETYARAKKAGAEIVFDLEEKSYGGTGFTCRDLEGHIWSIGTYNPWA